MNYKIFSELNITKMIDEMGEYMRIPTDSGAVWYWYDDDDMTWNRCLSQHAKELEIDYMECK